LGTNAPLVEAEYTLPNLGRSHKLLPIKTKARFQRKMRVASRSAAWKGSYQSLLLGYIHGSIRAMYALLKGECMIRYGERHL
jgi:hypothetical protein